MNNNWFLLKEIRSPPNPLRANSRAATRRLSCWVFDQLTLFVRGSVHRQKSRFAWDNTRKVLDTYPHARQTVVRSMVCRWSSKRNEIFRKAPHAWLLGRVDHRPCCA